MASKKGKKQASSAKKGSITGHIAGAGVVKEESITETLRLNYMPYAMSVIVSRAIPEIDGFKPSHRKILYTMYKKKLLSGARTKSTNVVGEVMKLNPHGDAAIYETMVRLAKGNESLLHPYIDSKGNFGKSYSRDMDYAASRYTEVRLSVISSELFRDIERDTVDFVPSYDNETTEPVLLPTSFPAILVNANTGIAVGMASSICSFNLEEVCETTIALLKNPLHDLHETLKAPDFPGGGFILYNREEMDKIYQTGRGGVRVRGKYNYDKANHCVDISEIPPSTTVEAIIDKIIDLSKQGKIREITDVRDETDLSGLKITIDLKRGVDPDKLMQKLNRMTPLEDTFSCNFNILIGGAPRVMGVREILNEWIAFRISCIQRKLRYDVREKEERLHLLEGLQKILLDIDKVIRIIRETEEERQVVPNLVLGFGIDQVQAEYVAEIRLRNLNKEYILKRLADIESLQSEIQQLNLTLGEDSRQRKLIEEELRTVIKKYGQSRKTLLLYPDKEEGSDPEEEEPDYPVYFIYTKEGYFKKITPQSLRMSGEQKLKENDQVMEQIEATNGTDLLFFTNKCQVYKSRGSDFSDSKASLLGDYIPAALEMEEGEVPVAMIATTDYQGMVLIFYENGKASKVPLSAYATKTRRRKLLNAFSDKAAPVSIKMEQQADRYALLSSGGRMLLVDSAWIPEKLKKDNQGVAVMTLKKNQVLQEVNRYREGMLKDPKRYQVKGIPATGAIFREEEEQMTLL